MSATIPAGYKQTEMGVIPGDWEVKPIGNCLKIRHGKSQHEVVSANGEFPIYGTGGEMGKASRPLYSKPSVLIGRKGTIDAPRYLDIPFWTVDTLFYSEVADSANPKFMFYKFCMIDWYSYNEASGVPSLNARTIEGLAELKISKHPNSLSA
jgi:type I restriction enzyme S subunit